MSTNFQLAIRQSFFRKIAIYLQQNGSRDMTLPLNFNNEVVDFIIGNTTYGVIPIESGQDPFYPGVSVIALDDTDAATGRTHSRKKRYLLPFTIITGKAIQGNIRPQVIKSDILKLNKLILECLSDGFVQIWDYEDMNNPFNTGIRGTYNDNPYSFTDESIAIPGGDIRMACTVFVNYLDPSV